jgi:serine protease AprX
MDMRMVGGLLVAMLVSSLGFAGETLRLKSVGEVRSDDKIVALFSAPTKAVQEPGLYIVQWKESVREENKAEVRALGLELLSYVPDDAFLVAGNADQANAVRGLASVRTVLAYQSGYKVDPAFNRMDVFSFGAREMVAVSTKSGVSSSDLAVYFSAVKKLSDGLFVGETSVKNIWNLATRSDVLWIEPYLPVRSMDLAWNEIMDERTTFDETPPPAPPAYTGYESGTRLMNVAAAYDGGFHGEGMLTAFADTGLDKGDLNNLIPDFQGQVATARALGLGGSSWGDLLMHGTHVAGSIAGNGASSDGKIRGAAFGAKLVVQGLYSDILQNISIPGIPGLLKKAYDDGARIHSNSWGAPNSAGRYDSFTVAVDKFMFDNMDFLAVFAAGNDGADLDKDGVIDESTVSSPGSAKNVLTVGASKNYLMEGGIQRKMADLRNGKDKWGVEPLASSMLSEDEKGMAAFSSRGPTADGRIKPEIVAPGTNIVSARSTHPKGDPAQSWGIYNDHYLYMGGTSMATPLTSGAATLVRQMLLKKLGTDKVSAALIKATMANT